MSVAETDSSTVNLIGDTLQLLVDIGRIRRWLARGVYPDSAALERLPMPIEQTSSTPKPA